MKETQMTNKFSTVFPVVFLGCNELDSLKYEGDSPLGRLFPGVQYFAKNVCSHSLEEPAYEIVGIPGRLFNRRFFRICGEVKCEVTPKTLNESKPNQSGIGEETLKQPEYPPNFRVPLMLRILIHYYTHSNKFPELDFPATTKLAQLMLHHGLLEVNNRDYCIAERGKIWLEDILNMPLPVQAWISGRNK